MKVVVAGLWHLGSVTAACLAKAGHNVCGIDPDEFVIENLRNGKAPLHEPGLNELLSDGINAGNLSFINKTDEMQEHEILWVAYDTPVDENDIADVKFVTNQVKSLLPCVNKDALVIISSQVPVGTTRELQLWCSQHYPEKNISFACSPENLRLGKAISVFTQPDRVIVGLQQQSDKARVEQLLRPFTTNIVWMSVESAEMTKHALNAFLATSVVFINEISTLCEQVGADAREVERGLKSEERIGPKAYLRPGGPIAGGTLARDVNFLIQIGSEHGKKTPLFSALLDSNDAHKKWSCVRLLDVFDSLQNKNILALGLTYKAGTDTLRRSSAIELCQWLKSQGANVIAYDPVVNELPEHLSDVMQLKSTLDDAISGVDALVVATEWPEFTSLTAEKIARLAGKTHVFDASGFLVKTLGNDERIYYHSVGRVA